MTHKVPPLIIPYSHQTRLNHQLPCKSLLPLLSLHHPAPRQNFSRWCLQLLLFVLLCSFPCHFACVVKSLPLQNANLPRALAVQKLLIDTVFFFLLLNCATILGMEWWRWHCAKSILEGNVTSSHLLDGMLWSGVSGLFISNSMSYST